jgi:hypothetical protein
VPAFLGRGPGCGAPSFAREPQTASRTLPARGRDAADWDGATALAIGSGTRTTASAAACTKLTGSRRTQGAAHGEGGGHRGEVQNEKPAAIAWVPSESLAGGATRWPDVCRGSWGHTRGSEGGKAEGHNLLFHRAAAMILGSIVVMFP